jgi:hypothetical protein
LDPTFAEALTQKQAELDRSLIEPTPMLERVMDFPPAPEIIPFLLAQTLNQQLLPVGVEVIHDEVNLSGEWIGRNAPEYHLALRPDERRPGIPNADSLDSRK